MKLSKKLSSLPAPSREEMEKIMQEDEIVRAFTKEKWITYAAFLFVPPYGIYRILKKDSPFRRSEKYVWTFMFVAYMWYLIQATIS